MTTRAQILVRGIVQGVGFRPFVFSHASRRALNGCVLNNSAGVLIDLEGDASEIDNFLRDLESNPPPLSSIESIERVDNLGLVDYSDFKILESDASGQKQVPISADVATCNDCLNELFDNSNRRYRYPFINCRTLGLAWKRWRASSSLISRRQRNPNWTLRFGPPSVRWKNIGDGCSSDCRVCPATWRLDATTTFSS